MIWEIRHVNNKNDGNLFGQWSQKKGIRLQKKTSSIKLIKNINGKISVKSKMRE